MARPDDHGLGVAILDWLERHARTDFWTQTPEEIARDRERLEPEPWRSLVYGFEIRMRGGEQLVRDAAHGPPVRARLYTPSPRLGGPLIVFFHGGGWVRGSLDSYDRVCRRIAYYLDARVLSVDYRLAPQHRFPAAVDDAVAAWLWVHDQARALEVDPARIVLMGDSAGGNLATVTCLAMKRDGGPMPAGQALVYPCTDATLSMPSVQLHADAPILPRERMMRFVECYAPGVDRADPMLSPLHAEDLSGLPPAYVSLAGIDPLVDEGLAYAKRLEGAGVAVTCDLFEDAIHGFFSVPYMSPGTGPTLRGLNDWLLRLD